MKYKHKTGRYYVFGKIQQIQKTCKTPTLTSCYVLKTIAAFTLAEWANISRYRIGAPLYTLCCTFTRLIPHSPNDANTICPSFGAAATTMCEINTERLKRLQHSNKTDRGIFSLLPLCLCLFPVVTCRLYPSSSTDFNTRHCCYCVAASY